MRMILTMRIPTRRMKTIPKTKASPARVASRFKKSKRKSRLKSVRRVQAREDSGTEETSRREGGAEEAGHAQARAQERYGDY